VLFTLDNGTTGAVVPFGINDDGGDWWKLFIMMMGLLYCTSYFMVLMLQKQHYGMI